MATYPIPWTEVFDKYNRAPVTKTGTILERRVDVRSPLTKTPKGPWRKPTSYNREIEQGRIATYDVSLYHKYHFKGYPAHYVNVQTGTGAKHNSGYYYVPTPAVPQNLVDRAVINCRLKLKNEHVNLAQAFGERKQTARLVSANLGRLANLVRNVKRRKLPKKEDFFSYWLEMQYGWKPLLSDVHGAMKHLHLREQEAGRGLVTVKSMMKDSDISITNHSDACGSSTYTYQRVRKIDHKAFVRLDFRQSNDAPVGTFTQLGITNPLYLAWELMPWSFVADWFIPVGDYLSQLDATNGWDFQGGSLSRVTRVETHPVNFKGNLTPASYDQEVWNVSGTGKGRQMKFIRTAYTQAPTPTRPSYSKLNEASNLHVANGIALLSALILGKTGVR